MYLCIDIHFCKHTMVLMIHCTHFLRGQECGIVYHWLIMFGVGCHWWFHCPSLLLNTKLEFVLFIRTYASSCIALSVDSTQPAGLPQ